jgi:uncharacterized membrane protein
MTYRRIGVALSATAILIGLVMIRVVKSTARTAVRI